MNQPFGITFKPSDQQEANGPIQSGREGLQSAIQFLSLRYPRVLGARTPVGDPSQLAGQGRARPPGFNPNSAAMLRSLISVFAGGADPQFQYINNPAQSHIMTPMNPAGAGVPGPGPGRPDPWRNRADTFGRRPGRIV